MADLSISLILPTIGRPTLARTLRSIRGQDWRFGDEVLLVGDGHCQAARCLWGQFFLPGSYSEVAGPAGDWGHSVRNGAMLRAKAEYLMAIDDDDELTTDAVAIVRRALAAAPDRPHMFRMDGGPHGKLWITREVRFGNVGTPMFVCPRHTQAAYTSRYGGDFDFMRDTLALYPPDALVWHEEVIAIIRPNA